MSRGIYWLASYPKSGNTWFRAFLENLRLDGDHPVHINELHTGSIASSRGWIDQVLGFDSAELDHEALDRLRPAVYRWSTRETDELGYHKIHDAYTLLPDGEPLVSREATCGVLYLVRNPLDVAVSLANHLQCDLDRAVAIMGDPDYAFCVRHGRLFDQVRQQLLDWSGHVRSWLDAPELNRQVIRYEDMRFKPLVTFTRAARFLELPDEPARVEKALRFSDLGELQRQEHEDGFREAPQRVSRFFRKGIVGDWRSLLNDRQIRRVIDDHGEVMARLGYLDGRGRPMDHAGGFTEDANPGTG